MCFGFSLESVFGGTFSHSVSPIGLHTFLRRSTASSSAFHVASSHSFTHTLPQGTNSSLFQRPREMRVLCWPTQEPEKFGGNPLNSEIENGLRESQEVSFNALNSPSPGHHIPKRSLCPECGGFMVVALPEMSERAMCRVKSVILGEELSYLYPPTVDTTSSEFSGLIFFCTTLTHTEYCPSHIHDFVPIFSSIFLSSGISCSRKRGQSARPKFHHLSTFFALSGRLLRKCIFCGISLLL